MEVVGFGDVVCGGRLLEEEFCGPVRGVGEDDIDARLRVNVLARWREVLAASAAFPALDMSMYLKVELS